ncbi:hypothetical protein SK128_011238 [Halocaridina rubra]|uniref:Uncharacterized protein n=1 Tax=Halocaridina rubra TaxID=373956 RepID=A0AAN8X698_HALRR
MGECQVRIKQLVDDAIHQASLPSDTTLEGLDFLLNWIVKAFNKRGTSNTHENLKPNRLHISFMSFRFLITNN